jgi:hypothetical protein
MTVNNGNETPADLQIHGSDDAPERVHGLADEALECDRAALRRSGQYGMDLEFFRELLGDDVCDYWNE